MIRLALTTSKLQALLSGVITTNQLPISVFYSDKTATTYNGSAQLTNTNSVTAVDICDVPAASTIRDIDYISVRNSDTAAATITVRYNANATLYTLVVATLAVGDHLTFTHGSGWQVFDSTGSLKQAGATIAASVSNTPSGGIAATNVQTALNELDTEKAPLASPTFTGTVTVPTPFTVGATSVTTTGTELNYVAGVTSAIQTQMNLKAPITSPTFTGTATIGVGNTLDISAGTLTLANDQISGDKVHGGVFSNFQSTGVDDNADALALTINASENIGFNTTDIEAYAAGFNALQLSATSAIMHAAQSYYTLDNIYYDGTFKYRTTAAASIAKHISGNFEIQTAPSGTIDTVATLTTQFKITNTGGINVAQTNTATVGAVTINNPSGRVNIAAAGTSVVVTNSLVTAASNVFAVAATNDATARVTSVVAAAGSFTIYTAATTAQTAFNFFVLN